ncbi:uncharacterized protein TRIADDRAFT_16650, partial [Trichoplax adhaerens]
LVIDVVSPFYNDPPSPNCPPGKSCPNLWTYEVVEIFFLGKNNHYLEVELCPHGQYLLLMLSDYRKPFKDGLEIEFKAKVDDSKWKGRAWIPLEYLPPGVYKANAYAIHGSGDSTQYEAAYPANKSQCKEPDFHRLEFFKDINLKSIIGQDLDTPSS